MAFALRVAIALLYLAAAGAGWASSSVLVPNPAFSGDPAYTLSWAFFRDADAAAPEARQLYLAVTVTLAEGGYIYGSRSSSPPKPTEIGLWQRDGKGAARDILFQQAAYRPDPLQEGKKTAVFTDRMFACAPLAPRMLEADLLLTLSMLLCSDKSCTPVNEALTVRASAEASAAPAAQQQAWWAELPRMTREAHPAAPPEFAAEFFPDAYSREATDGADRWTALPLDAIAPMPFLPALEVRSLGKAVLFGFLAGILLNCMPCVLPVLGLKLRALLAAGDGLGEDERKRAFRRSQVFTALGIVAWFAVLAVLFAVFGLAWGQFFQSTALVAVLILALFLLALQAFGVFSLPQIDFLGSKTRSPDLQAFCSGFAATLLATPCSGPLLGAVLGWALVQPAWGLLATLCSIGLGMAAPYLALAANPGLEKYLPKPGPWMRILEHGIGFLLLGTVVYLITLLPSGEGGGMLFRMPAALLLTAIAAWLWGQVGSCLAGQRRRIIAKGLAVGIFALACSMTLMPQPRGFAWQEYNREAFGEIFGKQPVLMEFTADWCPTCKLLEATTLAPGRMRGWQQRYGFAAVRVDITRDNPAGQELLRRLGSASIPVIALFPAGEAAALPLVLRDLVTPGMLEEALEHAFSGRE